jgi:mannosyltransferase OCH1-like enzyme
MHQIWLDEDSGKDVERYEAARNSCTTLHKREEG